MLPGPQERVDLPRQTEETQPVAFSQHRVRRGIEHLLAGRARDADHGDAEALTRSHFAQGLAHETAAFQDDLADLRQPRAGDLAVGFDATNRTSITDVNG